MKVSVYAIYILACLLACGAAVLSGIVLVNTFNKQQQESENAQLKTGMGQVMAMQTIIQSQMRRMRTASDANARAFLLQTSAMADTDFAPEVVINNVNDTMFLSWVPSITATDQVSGYGLTFMYTNTTSGQNYDRTIGAYWDQQMSGKFEFAYAFTSLDDGLCHAWRTTWVNYSRPLLVEDMYAYDSYSLVANTYMNDDFFDFAQPWSASDGNSYWFFTHMRAFHQRGIWINFQTWYNAVSWMDVMRNVLIPEAQFVAFDSQKHVMAATTVDEVGRLANCRGEYVDGAIPAHCIDIPADQHPTEEIRQVYTSLHQASWDDLLAGPIAPTMNKLWLNGRQYMAITSTLFSKDNFRTIIVWYQPWVTIQGSTVGLATLVCILTVLSTFVLTLMGVFGVLRPLMALGSAMRAVAHTLTDGVAEAVLEPRKPNVFHEVEAIGRDFETIVVDFLGFSSANKRDNKYAPKDPDKPFAVIFTDIESSTQLWGINPAEMSRCVQAHHELIRQLIKEHHLYEVKTVGDSFMVTASSAQCAINFALEVQTKLFDHDWGWDAPEELYHNTTLAFTRAEQGPLPGAAYSKLWKGLRVRVGIHYGLGEVTYDEVSKGYDYYGTVVNAAARIESIAHGGQVVVSEDLIKAMSTPLDPAVGILKPLGVFPLRGVETPPALVEVKPTRLRDRSFPLLRLEHALAHPQQPEGHSFWPTLRTDQLAGLDASTNSHRNSAVSGLSHHTNSNNNTPTPNTMPLSAHIAGELARAHTMVLSGLLSAELLTQHLLAMCHIVEDLLRPLAPPQHSMVAKALAQGWGVAPPKNKSDFSTSVLCLVHRMSETTKVLHHFLLSSQQTKRRTSLVLPDS